MIHVVLRLGRPIQAPIVSLSGSVVLEISKGLGGQHLQTKPLINALQFWGPFIVYMYMFISPISLILV